MPPSGDAAAVDGRVPAGGGIGRAVRPSRADAASRDVSRKPVSDPVVSDPVASAERSEVVVRRDVAGVVGRAHGTA